MQGILKAHKERAYREAIGDAGAVEKEAYYFVTVNPKPEIELQALQKQVDGYVKQKHVESVEWVYEQRGTCESDSGHGKHVHMLVKTNTNKADFAKRTVGKFKTLVGNAKHVDIRVVKTEWLEDKRKYMRGEKEGDGKKEKCEEDVRWRARNNIQSYNIQNNGDSRQTQAGGQEPRGAGS